LWEKNPEVVSLDDLFEMQKKIKDVSSVQLVQAEKACEERVLLRALGGSLSVPHGWEDLVAFA
jgi:hypothetical protein